jgi:hypothetical protein
LFAQVKFDFTRCEWFLCFWIIPYR